MANPDDPRPKAGPGDADAPAATGGGTYGQDDYSVAAQRSRVQRQKPEALAPKGKSPGRTGS